TAGAAVRGAYAAFLALASPPLALPLRLPAPLLPPPRAALHGLGPGLRSADEPRGRVCRVSSPQARRANNRDGPRCRIPPAYRRLFTVGQTSHVPGPAQPGTDPRDPPGPRARDPLPGGGPSATHPG